MSSVEPHIRDVYPERDGAVPCMSAHATPVQGICFRGEVQRALLSFAVCSQSKSVSSDNNAELVGKGDSLILINDYGLAGFDNETLCLTF